MRDKIEDIETGKLMLWFCMYENGIQPADTTYTKQEIVNELKRRGKYEELAKRFE
jgi:hypothetical protein